MTNEERIEANRANAQFSTGPRTEEGKAISSRNALTHGLTSKTTLLPGEDPAEFEALSKGMLRDLAPFNTVESALAAELISLQWRLLRVASLEARFLAAEPPDMKSYNNVGLQASRMKRQFTTTLKEFTQMHRENRPRLVKLMEKAEIVYMADNILERPSTLAENGFDFTREEIELWRARRNAAKDALQVVNDYEDQFTAAA